MKISDFDYALPDALIARYPAAERRASRLLEVGTRLADRWFADLPQLLQPRALRARAGACEQVAEEGRPAAAGIG
jgi:S-adenosylmethionine:tRNA ribosyltransferase-isomerase